MVIAPIVHWCKEGYRTTTLHTQIPRKAVDPSFSKVKHRVPNSRRPIFQNPTLSDPNPTLNTGYEKTTADLVVEQRILPIAHLLLVRRILDRCCCCGGCRPAAAAVWLCRKCPSFFSSRSVGIYGRRPVPPVSCPTRRATICYRTGWRTVTDLWSIRWWPAAVPAFSGPFFVLVFGIDDNQT